MLDFATRVLTAERGKTHLFSIGQAGFIIKSASGELLAIDLYLSNCVERIEGHDGFRRLLPQILEPAGITFDVIICTHPHLDHFDIDAVPEMMSNGSRLYCSTGCEQLVRQTYLEYYNDRISYIRPGDQYTVGAFDIIVVNCDHGDSAPDAVGIVIKVDGHTIYEAGDTCLRLDWSREIPQALDILIAPINGMYGNMDSSDVVSLSKALKPKITIPCHYGMFASHGGDLKRYYDLMEKNNLPSLIMRQGEQYTL